ncbi:MAG: cation-efflux pump [Candidatus Omnitrophica bacterium]|nr:cation-efflux pump [Candidatus Omnitrophota bacterium]
MDFNLTEFIIKKANLAGKDDKDFSVRARFGYLEGWISLVVNFFIFALKFSMGMISGSISIIADAVHTISDVATSAVVIWGFKIAQKPADKDHPFGHGRMEDIATLIIAVVLTLVGLELLHGAVLRMFKPVAVAANPLFIIFLSITVVIKEWLARFSFYLGQKIKSKTLAADAWHHRSDAISTLLVIVAVSGAMFRLFWLDAFFGAMVALYLMFMGIQLVRDSTFHLLGKAADQELIAEIKKIALSVTGVEGVHDIIAHDYGQLKAISLHVEVDITLDSVRAHQIATSVETLIAKNIKSSPIAHIDLKRITQEKKSDAAKMLDLIFKKYPDVINFHSFELLSNESGDFMNLHVVISKSMNVDQAHNLEHQLRESLNSGFKHRIINIHIEPCDSKCAVCPLTCKDI